MTSRDRRDLAEGLGCNGVCLYFYVGTSSGVSNFAVKRSLGVSLSSKNPGSRLRVFDVYCCHRHTVTEVTPLGGDPKSRPDKTEQLNNVNRDESAPEWSIGASADEDDLRVIYDTPLNQSTLRCLLGAYDSSE